MVTEARHGEWPGKSFNSVAQFCNASHCLWVLNQEVLEVLELSWKRQQKGEEESFFSLFYCHSFSSLLYLLSKVSNSGLKIRRQKKWGTYFGNQTCYIVMCVLLQSRPTRLLLDIQGNLEALIHEFNNLHKVCFFELSGGQSWSTWHRGKQKNWSLK